MQMIKFALVWSVRPFTFVSKHSPGCESRAPRVCCRYVSGNLKTLPILILGRYNTVLFITFLEMFPLLK